MTMARQWKGLLRPQTDDWQTNLGYLIGSSISNNIANQREKADQQKQAEWLSGIMGPMGQGQQIPANPNNSQYAFNPDIAANQQQPQDVSLLSNAQTFFPMNNQPAASPAYNNTNATGSLGAPNGEIPQADASQQQPAQAQQQQAAPQGFDYSLPPNRGDAVNQFGPVMAQKMKEAVDMGIPAKDAYAYIAQARDNAIAQQNAAWKQKQSLAIYDRLSQIDVNSPEAKKMLMYANYHGIPIGKEAWETMKPYEMKHVNAGDRFEFYDPRKVSPGSSIAIGVSPDAQLRADTSAANTNARIAAMGARGYGGRGGGGGSDKPGKTELWAQNYENNHLTRDNAMIDEYYGKDDLTPAQEIALKTAMANRERYWKISSGGDYGQPPAQQQTQQPQAEQQAEQQTDSGNADGAAWYDQTVRQLMASEGMSQEDAEQYLSEKINNGG